MSNNSFQDDLFDSLLTDFLDESGQLLDRLDQDLLRLDELVSSYDGVGEPVDDPELLNTIFRSAHSLKGLSAMLGLANINHLTHRLENVFDAARKKELTLTRAILETTFRGHDALEVMIGKLREGGDDSHNVGTLLEDIDEVLKLSGVARPATNQADAEAAVQAIAAEQAAATNNASQDLLSAAVATTKTAPASHPHGLNLAEITAEMERTFADAIDEGELPAKYVAIFIDETELSLDELFEFLLDEAKLADPATSEALMITMHRIKGSAASIGLHRPARLAHLAEDLLQELLMHKLPLSVDLAEALAGVADAIRTYVKGMRDNNPDSSTFVTVAAQLVLQGKLIGQGQSNPNAAQQVTSVAVTTTNAPPPVHQEPVVTGPFSWSSQIIAELQKHAEPEAIGWLGHVRFTRGLALPGMKAQLLLDKLLRAGTVATTIPNARGLEDQDDLTDFYFAIVTRAAEDALRPELQVAGVDEIHFQRLHGSAAPAKPTIEVKVEKEPESVSAPAPVAAEKPVANEKKQEANKAAANGNNGHHDRPNETLRVDIERLDQLMNLAGQLVINKARFNQIGNGMKDVLPAKHTVTCLNSATHTAERALESLNASSGETSMLDTDALRIQLRRLTVDLQALQAEFTRVDGIRSKVNEFHEAIHQLDRVAEGIQKSVMDTRMVPIGPLFQRFKRVVRDVTRTNHKDVRLTIRGEKTELDKRMIDELGDPLIHMVRNSADHGIETPEVRVAAGKHPQGEITLDAFHRGNSIVIQVKDDGKGLDRDRILAKAIEREIISPFDAERMTTHQIQQLIWEPGFSTADKVTEISGRGMGMDIVRSKIESLSGTVEVDSVPGQGATFTIKLPLTLAILPSLMSVIDGDTFAIPLESIVEIVRVRKQEVSTIHGLPAAQIRGRVVSIVDLTDLFTWSQPARAERIQSDDVTLVVIGHESHEVGLIVDHVVGEDDIVIKSLAENYKNVEGIAGASILGSGCVSLILDVAALVEWAAKTNPQTTG